MSLRVGRRFARRQHAAAAGLWLLGVAAGAPAAAQPACDARPGASSLPATRFQDNGDGTVTDRESKLMWMRCADGQQWQGSRCVGAARAHGWAEAQRLADGVNRAGSAFFNDWRLPALREIATITDRACANPRTNPVVFPDTPPAAFWTSTGSPGDAAGERLWALSFGAEGVLLARKDERFHVRLVRPGL